MIKKENKRCSFRFLGFTRNYPLQNLLDLFKYKTSSLNTHCGWPLLLYHPIMLFRQKHFLEFCFTFFWKHQNIKQTVKSCSKWPMKPKKLSGQHLPLPPTSFKSLIKTVKTLLKWWLPKIHKCVIILNLLQKKVKSKCYRTKIQIKDLNVPQISNYLAQNFRSYNPNQTS